MFCIKISDYKILPFLGFNDFSEFRDALEQKFDMGEDYTKQFQKQMHENSKEAIERYCQDIHSNIKKHSILKTRKSYRRL